MDNYNFVHYDISESITISELQLSIRWSIRTSYSCPLGQYLGLVICKMSEEIREKSKRTRQIVFSQNESNVKTKRERKRLSPLKENEIQEAYLRRMLLRRLWSIVRRSTDAIWEVFRVVHVDQLKRFERFPARRPVCRNKARIRLRRSHHRCWTISPPSKIPVMQTYIEIYILFEA